MFDLFQTTWRAQIGQGRGQNIRRVNVPRTCCVLQNDQQENIALNPIPVNSEKCQDLSEVTGKYRHSQVGTETFSFLNKT